MLDLQRSTLCDYLVRNVAGTQCIQFVKIADYRWIPESLFKLCNIWFFLFLTVPDDIFAILQFDFVLLWICCNSEMTEICLNYSFRTHISSESFISCLDLCRNCCFSNIIDSLYPFLWMTSNWRCLWWFQEYKWSKSLHCPMQWLQGKLLNKPLLCLSCLREITCRPSCMCGITLTYPWVILLALSVI